MISRQFVFLGAALLLSGMSVARAQGTSPTTSGSQSESLGDAAREARAQKKHFGKPAKVFTNDDMGRLKYAPSVIGNHSASASGTDRTTERGQDRKPSNGDDGKKDEATLRAKFAVARKTLADDRTELDVLQREFNLKQQQFYQDPNAALRQQYDARQQIFRKHARGDNPGLPGAAGKRFPRHLLGKHLYQAVLHRPVEAAQLIMTCANGM